VDAREVEVLVPDLLVDCERDHSPAPVEQVLDVGQFDEVSVADDPHAVTDPADLAEDV